MVNYTLEQKATQLPSEFIKDYAKVTQDGDIILVNLSDGWIRIDLADKSFAVGDYEG